MYPSTSFVIQIAHLNIEICGRYDEDSASLQGLRRIFSQHEVSRNANAAHRIVVCPSDQFKITREATLQWTSTCVGVAGAKQRNRRFFFRKKEVPQYSGTGEVMCYKDSLRQVEYYVPANAEWRIEHVANERVTYVYSDKQNELSDGLPSLLMHIIGSQYGCYLFYASCVAVKGEALLFTGNSGVGKSTLCMELMKQGASYIGDDLVLVYLKGEQPMIGSLLFPVKCYADRKHTHKNRIDVVSDLPQRPLLNVPLKSIYQLKRSDSTNTEPHLKPMRGEEVFEMMMSLTNKAHTNADGHHFMNTISFICDSVPCYSLYYGDCTTITTSFFVPND